MLSIVIKKGGLLIGPPAQAVFFPAGARALPAGNPKTSQEILTKAADKRLSWRKMTPFK